MYIIKLIEIQTLNIQKESKLAQRDEQQFENTNSETNENAYFNLMFLLHRNSTIMITDHITVYKCTY